MPKLLDVAAIFSSVDSSIASRIISNVFTAVSSPRLEIKTSQNPSIHPPIYPSIDSSLLTSCNHYSPRLKRKHSLTLLPLFGLGQQPLYWKDLGESMLFILGVIERSSGRLLALASAPPPLDADAIADTTEFLADAAFTLTAFVRVFPLAADSFLSNGLAPAMAKAYRTMMAAGDVGGDAANWGRACLLDAAMWTLNEVC